MENNIEESAINVIEMTRSIIGTNLDEIDQYLNSVRTCLLSNNVSDNDLDTIILRIPTYLYYLVTIMQDMDIKKGVAAEQASFNENDVLINSTGTVQEKKSKAENACIKDRMVQLAYKAAVATVQGKMNAAMEILSSAKKVQQRRLAEMNLTKISANSVSSF